MKILACLSVLLLVACTLPESENTGPLTSQTCPAENPRTGDSCCQFPDGYQCGACVCGRDGWRCTQPGDGGTATCPSADPKTGDACGQFSDGYQCGPCVCSSKQWSCHGGSDGGGPVTCPANGPQPGDSCSQFPKDYQCARCVCSANRVWACF